MGETVVAQDLPRLSDLLGRTRPLPDRPARASDAFLRVLGDHPLLHGRDRTGPRRRSPAVIAPVNSALSADCGERPASGAQAAKPMFMPWLASRGIRHRLARKGVESSRHLGRHRWLVERTVSWLSAADACTAASSASQNTSWPSPPSPRPSCATADSPSEMTSYADRPATDQSQLPLFFGRESRPCTRGTRRVPHLLSPHDHGEGGSAPQLRTGRTQDIMVRHTLLCGLRMNVVLWRNACSCEGRQRARRLSQQMSPYETMFEVRGQTAHSVWLRVSSVCPRGRGGIPFGEGG